MPHTNDYNGHKSIIYSCQNQLKCTYQLYQTTKHYTKHTTTLSKGTLIAKTSVFTEQDDRCVNPQHSRWLLKMDIFKSETCWAHNKLNKITSDFRLVFHYSTTATITINFKFNIYWVNSRIECKIIVLSIRKYPNM